LSSEKFAAGEHSEEKKIFGLPNVDEVIFRARLFFADDIRRAALYAVPR